MSFLPILLMVLFLICAVFMILLILVQKGRGEGLTAAFGGGGGQSAFGTKTADVLTKLTTYTAIAFFLISVVMAMILNRSGGPIKEPTGDDEQTQSQPANPAVTPAPEAAGDDASTETSSD